LIGCLALWESGLSRGDDPRPFPVVAPEVVFSELEPVELPAPARVFLESTVEEETAPLQLVQYPLESAAADDVLTEQAEAAEYAGPLGYLRRQLDCLPKDQRGLRMGETSATTTVLPSTGDDGFFFSTLDLRTSIWPARLPVFKVSPRVGLHLTDSPAGIDVPSFLFDTGIDVSLGIPLSQNLTVLTSVGPSLFTDGENLSSSAFRMNAMAIGFYKWSDTLRLAFGFVYLDREDISALPVAGVIYEPSERVKLELVFPRPKLAYRLTARENREHWCYLAGEFGGNSWAVERSNGTDDVLTYRDLRLIGGIEQKNPGSLRWLMEAGFVFNREIEYESGIGKFKPSSTGLVRGGLTF